MTEQVANLRESRKQTAAAKKAAAPKAAPAKTSAEKPAKVSTPATKITWKNQGEKNERG